MSLNGNYVDLIIILVLVYFISKAFSSGFIKLVADSISFLISLFVSLKIYKFLATFLQVNFNLTKSIAETLGFMFVTILTETFFGTAVYILVDKLPKKIRENKFDKALGIIPAFIEGAIFVIFILTLFVNFPIRPEVKKDILDSRIGGYIVGKTGFLGKTVNNVFGGVIDETLNYLAVETGSKGSINLKAPAENLTVDSQSETKMFELVNEERAKAGVSKLEWNPKLVPVAEAYATDMWKRSYFSHYSPEGKDVGNRLDNAKIKYQVAGENLALAPSLAIAHKGLMNSQGHRENILSKDYGRMGIGVIDNGVYGKIFVQIFTN